jgi:hypothetical protein
VTRPPSIGHHAPPAAESAKMRRTYLLPLLLLAAASPPAAPAPASGAVAFQVLDETDPQEISEDTVIFIDGHLVAHFVLDHEHTTSTATINLPAAAQYDYALCGRITIARPDGTPEQRIVDGGATLKDVNGHLFRALAAGDFTIFYLADARQTDPTAAPPDVHHTNACSLPVS